MANKSGSDPSKELEREKKDAAMNAAPEPPSYTRWDGSEETIAAAREEKKKEVTPPSPYTISPENKELRKKVDRAEDKENKKKTTKILVVVALAIVVAIGILISSTSPLDRILEYNVWVEPQNDGELIVTYQIKWKVLNDTREGPLEWVVFGLGNDYAEVIDYGGALQSRRPYSEQSSGSYAAFYLDRTYYAGEVAEMWFKIRQPKMLCRNTDDPSLPFYTFTPGWFNSIRIDHFYFMWKDATGVVSSEAQYKQEGWLVWEGRMRKGGQCPMTVVYDRDYFSSEAVLVNTIPENKDGGSMPSINLSGLIIVIIIAIIFIRRILKPDDYRAGGGFRGSGGGGFRSGGGGGGGGGSSCACACAGCACACACAGGGRAGCTTKDFYSNPYSAACERLAAKENDDE